MKALATFGLFVLLMLLVASPLLLITAVLVDSYAGAPFPVGLVLGTCLFDSLLAVWLIRFLRSTRKPVAQFAPAAKEKSRRHRTPRVAQGESQPSPARRIRPELCSFALRIVEAKTAGKPGDSYVG